jgi:hypothetical protein
MNAILYENRSHYHFAPVMLHRTTVRRRRSRPTRCAAAPEIEAPLRFLLILGSKNYQRHMICLRFLKKSSPATCQPP